MKETHSHSLHPFSFDDLNQKLVLIAKIVYTIFLCQGNRMKETHSHSMCSPGTDGPINLLKALASGTTLSKYLYLMPSFPIEPKDESQTSKAGMC